MNEAKAQVARSAGTIVLATLAAGQFLMMLDSSVMNVSIATVAQDVGTTVTGVQTAITLYTLVMAMFMITGGKIGSIIGRKRAFAIGCVVYGAGSLTTSLAQNLGTLILGWSVLEGLGAALIMPAMVALVASNFAQEERPRAYGLVTAAGAVAIALGPLIGGIATTYFSWRYVFAGEVLIVIGILAFGRKMADAPVEEKPHLDVVGAVLAGIGLGLVVFGVLRSGVWGWVRPMPGAPEFLRVSLVIWFVLAGGAVLWCFLMWENRTVARGGEPLVRPVMFRNSRLTGGLTMFFFQYLVQMGIFFTIPLFLSVALGLSAIDTGLSVMPVSITLLLAAAGVPKLFPDASPRRVVRLGLLAMLAGLVSLFGALEVGAGAEIITVPLLLAGLGMGALASQLGAVTVSSVPDEEAPEVGGLQNTSMNLGQTFGTALVGSVLIAALTASLATGIQDNPKVPDSVKSKAQVELSAGVPFMSDQQLSDGLTEAGVDQATTDEIVSENEKARIDALRAAMALLCVFALVAFFFAGRLPEKQPKSATAAVDV